MLNITVLAVGCLKEAYLKQACEEYRKRLQAYCRLSVVEISEHKLPQDPSEQQIQKGLAAEGAAILKGIPKGACVFALCIEGKMLTSEELASTLQDICQTHSHIVLIIGGSHGLCPEVKRAAAYRLSMSRMTFPHQLARVMLLEQLYRGFSIAGGGKYHK